MATLLADEVLRFSAVHVIDLRRGTLAYIIVKSSHIYKLPKDSNF